MQLTNSQVLNVVQSLNVLAQKKLPIKLSWKIATALRTLEPFAMAVDGPLKEIRMKYAVKDNEGNFLEAVDKNGNNIPNTVQIPNDKIQLLNTEMDDLLKQVVTVENVTLKVSDFPDNLEVEPTILSSLIPIINNQSAELSLVN